MFCNINFKLLKKQDLFRLDNDMMKHIVTVNAQFIVLANQNPRFMKIVNTNYATFDGEVPFKVAKLLGTYKKAETLKGSEIIYDFVNYAAKNRLKVFLLGGKEESNTLSVKKMIEEYGIQAAGYSPPFENYPFSECFIDSCMRHIAEFSPNILFVGFGAPKQEFFIEDNFNELQDAGIKYVIGCGGTFEFFSGRIKRAPKWISKIGVEGLYRLFQETNIERLKRLLISFKFFKYVFFKPDFAKSSLVEERQ